MKKQQLSTNLLCKYIDDLQKFIATAAESKEFFEKANDFSKVQKLSFKDIVIMLLSSMKKGIQYELIAYFYSRAKSYNVDDYASKSAFSQGRQKIKWVFFQELSRYLAKNAEKMQPEPLLFKGKRLLAVDGTTIYLPLTAKTATEFGEINNQYSAQCTPKASVLMDVMNGWCYNAELGRCDSTEKELLSKQLAHIPENSILVLDRYYPSTELIHELNERNIKFVIRTPLKWNKAVREMYEENIERDKTVTHRITDTAVTNLKKTKKTEAEKKTITGKTEITYRIMRVALPNAPEKMAKKFEFAEKTRRAADAAKAAKKEASKAVKIKKKAEAAIKEQENGKNTSKAKAAIRAAKKAVEAEKKAINAANYADKLAKAAEIAAKKAKETEGEEMLISNLGEEFTENDHQVIYNYRWGVETGIDALKNKIAIELQSGYTPNSIRQDFHASICQYNIAKFLYQVAQVDLKNKNKPINTRKNAKNYKQQINMALAVSLTYKLLDTHFHAPSELANFTKLACDTLVRFPEPVRPDRYFIRYHRAYKQRGRHRCDTNYKSSA
jgi:hypothetical protein